MVSKQTSQYKTCPKCKHYRNDFDAKVCAICNTSLLNKDEARLLRNSKNVKNAKNAKNISPRKKSLVSSTRKLALNLLSTRGKPNINSNLRELQKPLNLLGLFFVALGVMLWLNYILVISPNLNQAKPNPDKAKQSIDIPQGLFSYGGAPIFAPLVASGINGLIETKYPGYELRYTKPLNQDYSSSNGIRMLIDGELSFAYNERPLTDEEYKTANLRNINLKQIPIALDGVVVYGNKEIDSQQLNREQLLKIFIGEVNNWNQINPQIEDLPIVPVIVQDEDKKLLGISNKNQKLSANAEYTPNYTQALRKVISTPGSISFASATIVKNQKLIKMFDLADGNSSDYVSPTVTQVQTTTNTADFKSGRYPLTRRIFIVIREDGTLDQEAGMLYANYLTGIEGQKKTEETGLVPIANRKAESPNK